MPYCKKCKTDYGEDIKICPKCKGKLVPSSKDQDKDELLISVNEGFEADMVEGSLKSAGIPFIKKGHSGPAGFSRYDTKYESLGADFYVPSKLLERAKSQLPSLDGVSESAAQSQPHDEPETKTEAGDSGKKGSEPAHLGAKQILIIVLFLALMAVVVFGVDAVMNFFRAKLGY